MFCKVVADGARDGRRRNNIKRAFINHTAVFER